MAAIPLPLLLPCPSSRFPPDPIDDDENFQDCNTLTVLDYGDLGRRQNRWMTPQYFSLHLRCSRLMMKEAQRALRHHFRGESSEKLQHLLAVGKETKWQRDCLDRNENSMESCCYGDSLLPALLDDCEAARGLLQESLQVSRGL